MNGGPPPEYRDPRKMMHDNMPPVPKSVLEIPSYLKELVGGFFSRLFYIFRLVWDAKPWILFAMVFMSVFNGVRQ